MAILPTELSSLELTIASLSTYHSLPHRQPGSTVEGLDMNKTPTEIEEDWTSEATEHQDENIPRNKKLRLTTEQSRILEETFKEHQTLNPKQKEALSCILKLRPRQVEVWFQNRRARTKSKQTEMECEYLKRYFGTLSEENKRLQREIEELRSVKFPSSSIFDSGTTVDPSRQGSSLTMCPRCTRITATSVTSNPKHLQLL